jgi:hypothetical protein
MLSVVKKLPKIGPGQKPLARIPPATIPIDRTKTKIPTVIPLLIEIIPR